MAKKSKSRRTKKEEPQIPVTGPWISFRTGFKVIIVTSIAMALLTGWQSIQAEGNILKGIGVGLLFGGLIWLIFFGMIFINRKLR